MRWKAAAQDQRRQHTTSSCPVALDAGSRARYKPASNQITMAALSQRLFLTAVMLTQAALPHSALATDDWVVLLHSKQCPDCRLADADLVHADLRDADLSGAKLERANLSKARLDGADLSNADLSFTSLHGASLRGANLTGAKLYGQIFATVISQEHCSIPMHSRKLTGEARRASRLRVRAMQLCTTLG